MNNVIMFVFLAAIVALPAHVLGAPSGSKNVGYPSTKPQKQEKREKGVPEPATMLLVGAAAAGLIGVRTLIRRKRG